MDGESRQPPHSGLTKMLAETGVYMEEEWRAVIGYSWGYEASSLGRIRSLNYRRSGKVGVLHPRKNRWGYLEVTLWHNGGRCTVSVHKLIATAFLEKPKLAEVVNHKDGNKTNNRVDNLEWSTYKDNAIHSVNVLHKNIKPIICIETGERFWSAAEASRDMGLNASHIAKVAKGKRKSIGGYHFKYAEN